MTFGLIVGWYIFCAMLVGLVYTTMRGLTHSKFRDDAGDATTEIGYEEDPEGHDLHDREFAGSSPSDPHVPTPSVVGGRLS